MKCENPEMCEEAKQPEERVECKNPEELGELEHLQKRWSEEFLNGARGARCAVIASIVKSVRGFGTMESAGSAVIPISVCSV